MPSVQGARKPSAYLILYNLLVAAGWTYVVVHCVQGGLAGSSTGELWKDVELPLKIAQTAAVLEIVHSLTGVVKSPIMTTLMQVFSRIWLLWGIINLVPGPTTGGAVALAEVSGVSLQLNLYTLLYAWGVTEIIRYLFYALKELDAVPYVLTWLRYTTFYVLYPLGVSSEMAMVYLAMPSIRQQRLWSLDLPNSLNFGFSYYLACWVIVFGYLPGFPQLYMYMIKQRKKVLAPSTGSKVKAQ